MKLENGSMLADFTSVDMTSSITGPSLNLDKAYGYSITILWTGTPTGSFKLQCSNRIDGISGVDIWEDVSGTTSLASGVAGQIIFNVERSFYRWIRVVYTATSGSGTITNADYTIKGF